MNILVSKKSYTKYQKDSGQEKRFKSKQGKLQKQKLNGSENMGKQKSAKKFLSSDVKQNANKVKTIPIKSKQIRIQETIPKQTNKKPVSKRIRKKPAEKPTGQKAKTEEISNSFEDLDFMSEAEEKKPEQILTIEQKPSALPNLLKKEAEEQTKTEKQLDAAPKSKTGIFGRIFRKKGHVEQPKPSEVQEEAKLAAKSRKFERCLKILNEIRQAVAQSDLKKARRLHEMSRKLYFSMKNEEKKKIYDELNSLVNEL